MVIKNKDEKHFNIHCRPYNDIRTRQVIEQTRHLKDSTGANPNIKHPPRFIKCLLEGTVSDILAHGFNENFHVK
jgi:hypothetical protein